jgi:hypothetical protein
VPLAGEMQMMSRDDVSEELVKKKLMGTKILREEVTTTTSSSSSSSSAVEKTPPPKATIEKLEFKDKDAVDALFIDVRNDHTKYYYYYYSISLPPLFSHHLLFLFVSFIATCV